MSSRPWKENNFFSLNLISKRRENDFVSVWLSYPVASIQTGNGSNSFSYFFLKFCLIKWTEKMVIDALIEDLSCCVCPHSRFIILPLRDVIKTRSRRYVYTLDSMVRVTLNVVINLQTKKKKNSFQHSPMFHFLIAVDHHHQQKNRNGILFISAFTHWSV